jgi:WD40 repeat protein
LHLWDLESGAELRRFEGHERGVNAVAVLADDKRALSAGDDRTVRLWDLDSSGSLPAPKAGSQTTSVAAARINSHMSILLGRDQDGRRLRRSDPTRQSGGPHV